MESLKIIQQAIENLPSGPLNVDTESKQVIPDKSATYRSIEGLIQHFELFMTNRQWTPPVDEVYGAQETANGELGFYVVSDGTGRAYRARTRPPSFIHFAIFPYLSRGASDQRHCGGLGKLERHRGRVGSLVFCRVGRGPPDRVGWVESSRPTRSCRVGRVFEAHRDL